ncbi:haloacid dehalogenase type II [Flavobacterium sp. U410]
MDKSSNRRDFIKKSAMLGLAGVSAPYASLAHENEANTSSVKRPKVLFFDVNETLLDLTAMKQSVGKALGGRTELLPLWFTTMLQYSLVSTVGRQYEDFAVIGAACLQMVAANNNIELTAEEAKSAIVTPIRSLPPHPEIKASLKRLREAGYKMVSLTNSSNKGVKTQFENVGLLDFFEERLTVEELGKYKPHADVYDWAARKMGVQPHECMLIAAHGWDIAGALWANWRGAFIKRPGAQLYPLAPTPEINEVNLTLIADQLIAMKS